MKWLVLLLAVPLWAQQPSLGGIPIGGVTIPVTFVNGVGTSGTNVALGVATGCAADTYCLQLPPASGSDTVLANNLVYLAVEYASTGTTPTVKLGSTSFTGLSVSGTESSKKVADFYLATASAGSQIITVATSAVKVYSVTVVQFAGLSGLDGAVKGTSSNTANNTLTGPSLTPLAGDGVILVGCLAGTPARTSFTAGSGTNITFTTLLTDIGDGCAIEYGVQGTSATYTPTLTTAGTASTYIVNAAAFSASTTTGTLPTGMYVAAAMETQKPLTATQVAAGTASYQFPSTGNLLVLDQACGNFGVSSITDTGNSGKWVTTFAGLVTNPSASIAYAPNAAADASGLMTVTYQSPSGSNGDCDGFLYDVHGAATVPNGNHMQVGSNQGSFATPLTVISGYIPGISSGLIFSDSSNQANTVSSLTAPANAFFMTPTFGGQSQDGPSLPGQNNLEGISSISSNSSLSVTIGLSGTDAVGQALAETMSFGASGATYGILGNQFKNSPTVAGSPGHLAVTLTPRTTSGVIWAFVAWDDQTHTMSCSDATNGAYNAVDSPVNGTVGGTALRFQTFWVANTTTSSITPTCTVSSGGSITTGTAWLAVHEILGVTTIDKHPAVLVGTGSGTGWSGGTNSLATCNATGTLSTANEYLATADVVASSERSSSAIFTLQQSYNAGAKGDASGDLVLNATTTVTPVWVLDTGGDTFACAVNTFE